MTNVLAIAIAALIQVESVGNPHAVGDNGRAVGILQQWPVSVHEANRLVGKKRWSLADRRDPAAAREMASVILARHYRRGVTDPVDLASRWRNPHGNAPAWYRRKLQVAMAPLRSGSYAGQGN
jgi:soluble lytic murein transglycosylase-like protein